MSDELYRYLPSHFKLPQGESLNLPALVSSIELVFEHVDQFLVDAQKQLFFATAEGKYLIQLAAAKGFFLERGSGINVEGFKKIAPLVALAPKQALATIVQLLEAFYSSDLVKASLVSDEPGPYTLQPGDTLTVRTGSEEITIGIPAGAFSDFQNISVGELAAYINALRLGITASAYVNQSTGQEHLRIISGVYGAASLVQVVGGTAAGILRFPSYLAPAHQTGTQLLLTKPAAHSDLVTIAWDTTLPDPELYRLSKGDFVSFRNLFDVATTGVQAVPDTDEWGYVTGATTNRALVAGNYSVLNSTHEVIAVDQNSFTIRLAGFFPESNAGNVFLRSTRDMHLQQNKARRLYEQPEYAVISETLANTVTVTVPAVPPIVKRFLEGAWHLHGAIADVTAVTRTSITMTPRDVDFPDVCQLAVRSPRISLQLDQKYYQTAARAVNTWTLAPDSQLFPYTIANAVNPDTIYPFRCDLDSDLVRIIFKEPHACIAGYALTVASAAVNDGFDMNGTWPVVSVQDDYQLTVRTATPLTGAITSQRVSIERLPTTQPDGSNAYIQFASVADRTNSGIVDGTRVKLVVDGSTVVSDAVGTFRLLQGYIGIVSTSGDRLYISASISPGTGSVVQNAPLRRAIESWGGSPTAFVDLTIASNASYFANMTAVLVDYVPQSNPLFVGSYAYDPNSRYTLSSQCASVAAAAYAGSSNVVLSLSGASAWVQPGHVVLAHGTSNEEGPIRYTSLYQEGGVYRMVLDPTYVLQNTHAVGVGVCRAGTLEAPSLDTYGQMFQPYLTGTSQARDKLFDIIRSIVAAGVFVDEEVLSPELEHEDPSVPLYS